MNEFKKFATRHLGMNTLALENYMDLQSSYISPTIIEERQLNVAQMDVFSRLMMDRIIFLGTDVNDQVANIVTAQLLFLESVDSAKDIQIYINSPGGSVYAGLGMYDTMQFIKADVSTTCIGQACSMGAFLLAGGAKGKRFCLPNSRVMIHQPLGGFQGQASDIQIVADEIDRMRAWLEDTLSKHSGKPVEQVRRDIERDKILTAEEAVEYGIIDQVFDYRKLNG